jgi:hypothetical protein
MPLMLLILNGTPQVGSGQGPGSPGILAVRRSSLMDGATSDVLVLLAAVPACDGGHLL